MERLSDPDRWVALVIILFTIGLFPLVVIDRSWFGFSVGPLLFTHWLRLLWGFWIAIVTPIFYVMKHRRPMRMKAWVRIHVFGNLVAFTFISIHFIYWISTVHFIGTGMALFVAVLTLIVTGLMQRFNIMKNACWYVRFLHISMTTAFYLVLAIHVLSHIMRI